MKLIHLKMCAFGPYKSEQTIDFEELEEHRLFVISGKTGAGKTTIFDAITFALYGTASGSDRSHVSMLRSHFASDDIYTSVELTFQLRDKTYRIFRQLGHIKEGNKTKTGDKTELFLLTEEGEKPAVDRQITSEVNEKVESLIGLTEQQFKQIVMLPQGEFRKLLTSNTENKEAILRRLFQTGRYQHMNDYFKEKLSSVRERLNREQEHMDRYIYQLENTIEIEEDSKLQQLIEEPYRNITNLLGEMEQKIKQIDFKIIGETNRYEKAVTLYETEQKRTAHARMINEQFSLMEEKEMKLLKLKANAHAIKEKEQTIVNAEKAKLIQPYEEQYEARLNDEKLLIKQVEENRLVYENAQKSVEVAIQKFKEEEGRTEEREQLKNKLLTLENYLPIVKTIDEEKKTLMELQEKLEKKKITLEQLSTKINSDKQLVKQIREQLTKNREQVKTLADNERLHHRLRSDYKLWDRAIKTLQEIEQLNRQLEFQKKEYEQATKNYEKLESNWINQQAAYISKNLREGEPCPVCGSTHHPIKQHEQVEVISDELLKKQKHLAQTAQNAYYELQGSISSKQKVIAEIGEDLNIDEITLQYALEQRDYIIKQGKEIKQTITSQLELVGQIEKMEQDFAKLENELEERIVEKEQTEKQYNEGQLEMISKKASFEQRISEIPQQYQQLKPLQNMISETNQLIKTLTYNWETAEKNLKEAETILATSKVSFDNSVKQRETLRTHVQKAMELFKENLKASHFDNVQQYKQAKIEDYKLDLLKKEVEQYKQTTMTLQSQLLDLKNKLKDEERYDIKEMEKNLDTLKQHYEEAFQRVNEAKQQKLKAEQIRDEIRVTNEKLEQLEAEVVNIMDIYDTLRGQNSRKISFERYLQIDYLEQIIYAANLRFKMLSDGQYYLVRSDRQESHGRQSGLTIDVYDSYTGQMRDVKTLSGGEKFIASLCLALGMSDVIQSFQGNIQIETMFIDEGFGSLDDESLQKSIDTLIQLQKTGRTIGVISHVNELKRMLPARLEVTKHREGYSSASFILRA